jgi:hypothetical protein
MKIEYHTFDVEPWLKVKQQPIFTIKGTGATSQYYTLIDPTSMEHALTTSLSEGVRVPVFAVATTLAQHQDANGQTLGHGSLLFAMGMENTLHFVNKLQLRKPINRAIIAIATNCHALAGDRYRAYFGITLEVET